MTSRSQHCSACEARTCTICKGPDHGSEKPSDCPKDEGVGIVKESSEKEGSIRSIVSRSTVHPHKTQKTSLRSHLPSTDPLPSPLPLLLPDSGH